MNAEKVVLGLGWYGRSFTLDDSSCNTPNGICEFSAGGNAGECTDSVGTLSNAEIFRILNEYSLTPTLDTVSAVNWITWDTDQWVSYDDEVTLQLKMDYANSLGLAGTMIWAVDLDDSAGTTNSDLFGTSNATDVYIDGSIWDGTSGSLVYCDPPCRLILPPYQLSSTTTISFPLLTTSLQVVYYTTTTAVIDGTSYFQSTLTSTIQTASSSTVTNESLLILIQTTLTIPAVTTTGMS